MKTDVLLPVSEPIYSTYHYQSSSGALLSDNPSIRNYYLNQVMLLKCNRKFLFGYTSPWIDVEGSDTLDIPYTKKYMYCNNHFSGITDKLIKNILDDGYYVSFSGVDDYYVKGKSWYHERHFNHTGQIYGYSSERKTYSIYAYDDKWRLRVFETPVRCFNKGMKSMLSEGKHGIICGFKAVDSQAELSPKTVLDNLKIYLDSSLNKYPPSINDDAYGTVVHDYLVIYLGKLIDESVPYEKKDRRIMRMIWEHKKVMLERILAVENQLCLEHSFSSEYEPLVKQSNDMRILYASYCFKKRDSALESIQNNLINLKNTETKILSNLAEAIERTI